MDLTSVAQVSSDFFKTAYSISSSNLKPTRIRVPVMGGNYSHNWECRQSQSPYNFFLSGCCCSRAKISFTKSISIFIKRETLQKRHKQSNKHVFRVCMHSYMYITKVT